MSTRPPALSSRKAELLEAAYEYALDNGVGALSLRPLASAIGSSPRVLLYLFGSKDGLIRALLARARADELAALERLRSAQGSPSADLVVVARELWSWLATPDHRRLLTLWVEGYARSLVEPDGPWAGFARGTVEDWLALLTQADPGTDVAHASAALAMLRGSLLDLLATGDLARTNAAVDDYLRSIGDRHRR